MSTKIIKTQSAQCRFFPACGGCSYLHLNSSQYKKIKEEILFDALKNFDSELLKKSEFYFVGPQSRRKIILQIDRENNLGFFAALSKNLVKIDSCFVAATEISALILPLQNFMKNFETSLVTQIAITSFDNVCDVAFYCKREPNFAQIGKITELAKALKINASYAFEKNVEPVYIFAKSQIFYSDFKIDLNSEIFIQATKEGLNKISEIILNFVAKKFAEKNSEKQISVADIYAGFGAYTFALAKHVKKISAFEGSEKMTQLISNNAAKNGLTQKIKSVSRDLILHPLSEKELSEFDLVIINPPRNGAGPQAEKIAKSKLQNLIYVSCNPKTFVADAKKLTASGFAITNLCAIDQFYGSAHLELVAVFER